jgi:hypothetical protein
MMNARTRSPEGKRVFYDRPAERCAFQRAVGISLRNPLIYLENSLQIFYNAAS